jgi:hypothetical protein
MAAGLLGVRERFQAQSSYQPCWPQGRYISGSRAAAHGLLLHNKDDLGFVRILLLMTDSSFPAFKEVSEKEAQ